jgi:hypothetical protein
MIQLFKNIENYRELSLRDMAVVAENYDYFVPPFKGVEFWSQAAPLVMKTRELTSKYFGSFEGERKKMADLINRYFDPIYFGVQKAELKKNMFDTNYLLKDYLNKMTKEQLVKFGTVVVVSYVKNYNFMTHWNWLCLSNELCDLAPKANHNIEQQFRAISKEKVVELLLKYIDLNIILADNLAESILNGSDFEHAMNYVISVIQMRRNNVYQIRVLM